MKSLAKFLFAANTAIGERAFPVPAFSRVSAEAMQLAESWFRDAIFDNPELVIGPCREAGRITAGEEWLSWGVEVRLDAGPMDVLLVSSLGRIAIVETKLSYNPQRRREVVAQILDYALALQETAVDNLPDLPEDERAPDMADLQECLSAGRFLLIVAGDSLDPRAIRLSQAVLAGHLTSEWDLAMIDLNMFVSSAEPRQLLVVPELRGTVLNEIRQVVRVQVEGTTPRARVIVERSGPTTETSRARSPMLASEQDFLSALRQVSPSSEPFAIQLLESFRRAENGSGGKLQMRFQRSTANLHWLPEGTNRTPRVLSLGRRGDLRVCYDYLVGSGFNDAANHIRILSSRTLPCAPEAKSASIAISLDNISGAITIVEDVARLLVAYQGDT